MKTDRGVARGLPGIFSGRNSVIALIALTLLAIRPVWAGDTEKQIKLDYLEKVLTLRHFYSG